MAVSSHCIARNAVFKSTVAASNYMRTSFFKWHCANDRARSGLGAFEAQIEQCQICAEYTESAGALRSHLQAEPLPRLKPEREITLSCPVGAHGEATHQALSRGSRSSSAWPEETRRSQRRWRQLAPRTRLKIPARSWRTSTGPRCRRAAQHR